jgi:hypothetical protein
MLLQVELYNGFSQIIKFKSTLDSLGIKISMDEKFCNEAYVTTT